MKLNEHRKDIATRMLRAVINAEKFQQELFDIASERAQHPRGVARCIASKLWFVDSMSEMLVTHSNQGTVWMGLWLDCPLHLHDGTNEPSLAKIAEGQEAHGNTLFPRWLAEVLLDVCDIHIDASDIYDV